MPPLLVRVLSALAAVGILGLAYYVGEITGLVFLSFLICTVGTWEYNSLTIRRINHKPASLLFQALAPVGLALAIWSHKYANAALVTLIAFNLAALLWVMRGWSENSKVLQLAQMTGLGYLYTVFLPGFAISTLQVPDGLIWFLLLLLVTFAGDTFAYFGGLTFGKHKLMPELSPKKSIEGALFGLVGSVLMSLIYTHYLIPEIPKLAVGVWAVFASFLCQTGDLFESLLKREANVKDSGRIMPGHGGVLDRLDGVYFGAPAIYLLYSFYL